MQSRVFCYALCAFGLAAAFFAADDPLKRRGEMGAFLQPPSSVDSGAAVAGVERDSPAQKAGLLPGDRVLSIGGRRIADSIALQTATAALRAGESVELKIRRGAETLMRRVTPSAVPREVLEGLDVIYASVVSSNGERLRTITTRPKGASGRLPAILLVGWLSCDSVELPLGREDGFARLHHGIATRSGYVLLRVDKPGTGDSEGVCAETDFAAELAGYRAAFRALRQLDFVDPARIVLLGMSNGGGVAPLVPEGAPVAGYVVSGGWVKTWFEHMMEIERRRLTLSGRTPGEVSAAMHAESQLYDLYLNGKKTPGAVVWERPGLAPFWSEPPGHQYGRPASFYQQLQDLNLAAAWDKVSVPVLAVHGEFDWIMSREDHETIAAIVNRNWSGLARFVEIPRMDHFYLLHDTPEQSFRDEPPGTFATTALDVILDWLRKRASS